MQRFRRVSLVALFCLIMTLMLAACGGNPTATPAPVATTAAAKPTTAAPAATTAAAKPSTAAGAATTPAASGGVKKPAPSGTPAASAKMPATVPTNATSEFDKLLTNVINASNNIKSTKISMLADFTSNGTSGTLALDGVFVAPDRVQFDFNVSGQQVDIVQIGSNIWLGTGGVVQKVSDVETIKQYANFLEAINLVILGDTDLKKFAGSDMVIYPNQMYDGKEYGAFYINTANAADKAVRDLGEVVYFFDAKTYQIALAVLSSPGTELLMSLENINDPKLQVSEPK